MTERSEVDSSSGGGANRPRRKQARRRRAGRSKPVDLWAPVAPVPEARPITPAPDPAALIRSLGDPPMPGQGAVAEHYLAAVIERAAGLAMALAAAAGQLAEVADDGT